jgi:hypothetical protein
MYIKEDDLPSAGAINSHVYAMAGVQTRQIKSNWIDIPLYQIFIFASCQLQEHLVS